MALDKKGRDDLREKALNTELIGTEWAQKLGCVVRELLDHTAVLVRRAGLENELKKGS